MIHKLLLTCAFVSTSFYSVGRAETAPQYQQQTGGQNPQSNAQSENIPAAFFIDSVEVVPFAKDTADPSGEFGGAIHVWVRVRTQVNSTNTYYVKLNPIYPPTEKSASKNATATLDLLASAVPGTSDVCVFPVVESIFIYHSELPVALVRVRSANNVVSIAGAGRKVAVFKKPDCAGIISSKVSSAATPTVTGQGSAQTIRAIRASDSINDGPANPNRMSLFLDDSDNVSAILWE